LIGFSSGIGHRSKSRKKRKLVDKRRREEAKSVKQNEKYLILDDFLKVPYQLLC
jgi:hypothetical protein